MKQENNRKGFIKGLIAAGYVASVVNQCAFNDSELLRLAVEIYNDVWECFDKGAFESGIA